MARNKTLPSVMGKRFNKVPMAKIARSSFNRSHEYKTTFDAGILIPVFIDEALPGDTFNLHMNAFARLATPIKPLMDNLYLTSFFFAVPHRLLWTNFVKFMGEQDDPGDTTDYTIPMADPPVGGYPENSWEDYAGLPINEPDFLHSALPGRAYYLIWNEWFRDQNLQNSLAFSLGNGPDAIGGGGIGAQRRGKRHDYFTSCLPWPQKGDAVTISIGDTADIVEINTALPPTFRNDASTITDAWLKAKDAANPWEVDGASGTGPLGINEAMYWSDHNLEADLSTATPITINAMREAFQIQKLLERDARGGTRYTEIVKSHFGVTSPDARLQRPEYLGGGRSPVVINPIAQTSNQDAQDTPQGNLAAMGTVNITRGHGFVKSFTEHCVLMGMICVDADLNYQHGIEKMWSRSTRYDFYWPAFAGLGEQAVYNREIWVDGTGADDAVWGYQERHAEYRYKPSKITGLFRSNAAGTLDIWHVAERFVARPALNAAFIVSRPPIDDVIATQNEPHFLLDSYFQLTCARPMPVYGVPGLIDHF